MEYKAVATLKDEQFPKLLFAKEGPRHGVFKKNSLIATGDTKSARETEVTTAACFLPSSQKTRASSGRLAGSSS